MKTLKLSFGGFWLGFILLFLGVNTSWAQDATKVDPKHYKVELDNNDVRVLRIKYGPGDESVMHEHPKGVVVFLTDSDVQFTLPDGKKMSMTGKAGDVIWTDGDKHQPKNTGDKPLEAIQIELKSDGAAGGQQRYTTSSPLIDKTKSLIEAYENQDWDTWKSQYTEDSQIFHNNWDQPITPDEFMNGQKEFLKNVSSYEFVDDPVFYEQVVDDDGQTWVYFWGVWEGTLKDSGTKIRIPVHLAILYRDGKNVEEYGFYDMTPYYKAIGALNED